MRGRRRGRTTARRRRCFQILGGGSLSELGRRRIASPAIHDTPLNHGAEAW